MPMIGNIDFGVDHDDGQESSPDIAPLPLHLLMMVISYLDSPADLARACRTCRLLHYMCLPTLYADVSLHSYDHIRYTEHDNRPEGMGGASPFSMGLNALVTRNVAGYVKRFRVWGKWKEYDSEECAKLGRVPDSSMMLNLLIRAAVDRMPALESFSWELDTKMLPNVWQGLVQRPRLVSLKVDYPTLRLPRLTTMVPPMPHLKSLHLKNLDPLCYPDNFSLLILRSKKLEDLKLHWSPRMREAREPSVNLHTYFGKCLAAKYQIPLKHLSFQNLFAFNEDGFQDIVDSETIESFTLISSVGGDDDAAEIAFLDSSWKTMGRKPATPKLRMLRGDKISSMNASLLTTFSGMERYYLVTGRKLQSHPYIENGSIGTPGSNAVNGHGNISGSASPESTSQGTSSHNPCMAMAMNAQKSQPPFTPPAEPNSKSRLGKDYIENISKCHGSTLRHLLLMPQWRLSSDDLARLVRSCPNLEQLGFGMELANFNMLRLLIPFLPKLYAIRILDNVDDSSVTNLVSWLGHAWHHETLGHEMGKLDYDMLRWVGIGDHVFEVLPGSKIMEEMPDGEVRYKKAIRTVSLEAVKNVEIWSMDRLEI